jgi:crotonobetainyl-CoA:carnitine CoA-transferase CaiB-like acyl-CoA transferase
VTAPLSGLRVVELQGRGPGPFGAMLLTDPDANVPSGGAPHDLIDVGAVRQGQAAAPATAPRRSE